MTERINGVATPSDEVQRAAAAAAFVLYWSKLSQAARDTWQAAAIVAREERTP